MCGIAGVVAFGAEGDPANSEYVRRMLAMLRHRGPDQFGIYRDAAAAMGCARLSIVDIAGGRQPISNEDGTLWIVFNGEIFNYLELRPDLERRGHCFRTDTDTEVLLHLYEEYGAGCLERVNGQFAVAIWDARERRLFLARDRMGIRPLFYTRAGDSFLFASEVKGLLAVPGVTTEIDPVVLDQVFVYWAALPGNTVFRGIEELPPGHYLTLREGRQALQAYWSFGFTEPVASRTTDEYLDELHALLDDATRIRLRSEAPGGLYLSGGLDSSVVAGLASSHSGVPLRTFGIGFDEPAFDESDSQARVSNLLGTRHSCVRVPNSDIGDSFQDVVWHAETPLTRTAPGPMYLLSRLARDSGCKFVLTGEGADEILAGYDLFKEAAIRRFCARRPESKLRPLLFQKLYSDIAGLSAVGPAFRAAFYKSTMADVDSPWYSHAVRWRNNARARRFFNREVTDCVASAPATFGPAVPSQFSSWDPLQRAQYLETTILLTQYLLSSQGDRMGMAHSVESRTPFLDYRVVEFCNRLPSRLKLRGLKDKYLLRRLGARLFPQDVFLRPKRPYRAPVHKSFRNPLPDYVMELLSPRHVAAAGLFQPAAVATLVKHLASGAALGETDDMALAGILSTQIVHRQFITHFRAAERLGDVSYSSCPQPGLAAAHGRNLTVGGANGFQ
jgi:asparagine synthase (glutamine-hydrolysing)